MDNAEKYIGTTFGDRYTVINIIGGGETSVVLGAYDTSENRTVALKLLRPEYNDDPEAVRHFTDEAEIMASLSHPHIVKIFDTCLESDLRYFVMEYVEGITLKKHILCRGPLPTEEILFLSRQILLALEAIHDKGIVHSDIKPMNVVVLPNGHACLVDFGISKHIKKAKDADDPATFGGIFTDYPVSPEESSSDLAIGTVHYVSPEQAEGREIDHRSDLYSFGVMLYEMATGTLPFIADSPQELAIMHVRTLPDPPRWREPSVPEGLEKIILRTMEKLPIARFASASDLQKALGDFATQQNAPADDKQPPSLPPLMRFRKMMAEYIRDFDLPSFTVGALSALLVAVVISLGILSEAVLNRRDGVSHVKVPELESHQLSHVAAELDPDYYQLEITYITDNNNPGRVIEQSPAAGRVRRVSENKKCVIHVTVAKRALPPTMPDFSYLPAERVLETLSAYDCEVRIIEQPHELAPEGTVLATTPDPRHPTEHVITLYVSAGWQQTDKDTQ